MATQFAHPKRGTAVPVRHNGRHLVGTESALDRFRKYCQFDLTTGCVLWTGGTAHGRGNSAPYGVFWYEGKRWFAHRWAGVHIHKLELEGYHADHCCDPYRAGGEPLPANTLCVQHVQPLTPRDNALARWERQTWLLTQKGYLEPPPLFVGLEAPPAVDVPGFAPVYEPPAWLVLDGTVKADDGCPF